MLPRWATGAQWGAPERQSGACLGVEAGVFIRELPYVTGGGSPPSQGQRKPSGRKMEKPLAEWELTTVHLQDEPRLAGGAPIASAGPGPGT